MMSKAEETRETVLGYFNAWTSKRTDEAYAFLAEDLVFWGPTASYASAEQFRPGLVAFAGMTKRAQLTKLVVEGEWAAMYYDCELPAPIGNHQDRFVLPGRRTQDQAVRDDVRRDSVPPGAGVKLQRYLEFVASPLLLRGPRACAPLRNTDTPPAQKKGKGI
jgi:hypothetical protein